MEATKTGTDATLDVLIVGAGLSGIGAACHIRQALPELQVAIVEARHDLGGTWDLFRYPGVRSDSDMYTLGYRFRPWTGSRSIADGAAILAYLRETAASSGVDRLIRYGHRVLGAAWSSADACWTVRLDRDSASSPEPVELRARFLYCCTGYFSYDAGHRPAFDGEADFRGRVVHPQFWPADLDCSGRRIVVIGSGATAVTLVPALAATAAHVTMLQRSPSYLMSLPANDGLAGWLQRVLPASPASTLVRWKNLAVGGAFYRAARRWPGAVGRLLIGLAAKQSGASTEALRHFSPRYGPWDQRLCVVPDGDLFEALRDGRASIVTDSVDRFTSGGIRTASGTELEADIVVVATGLEILPLGGIDVTVDGTAVRPGDTMVYKGALLAGVPNLALAFGYANASWTLRADLTAAWVCRLLRHMARRGARVAIAEADAGVPQRPFLTLTSGYVRRADTLLPRQGTRGPWRLRQSYVQDAAAMRFGRLDDGVLRFR